MLLHFIVMNGVDPNSKVIWNVFENFENDFEIKEKKEKKIKIIKVFLKL